MKDLERAKVMERVLRDINGEGNSVATLAKRFSLSEESISTILGIRAKIFTLESETGGPGADLAKLEEDGIEPSRQLREVFAHKNQSRSEPSR